MKHSAFPLAAGLCIFISCSSPINSFYDIKSLILYDFQTGENLPAMRLALYVRLNADADTEGSLRIFFPPASYTWEIEKPVAVYDGDSGYLWLGSSGIMPLAGLVSEPAFPAGQYRLTYIDSGGVKTETHFTLNKMHTVRELDIHRYKNECTAVFSESGILLGYADEQTEAQGEDILQKYPEAFFTRKIRLADDGLSAVLSEPVFFSDNRISEYEEEGIQ